MTSIEADDPVVADLLAGTLELVGDAGGWVHPAARLIARGGQFSLECAAQDDEPLLVIPRGAFVRVDAVIWADDPTTLRVLDLPDDIGDTEMSLVYLQSALHNQADRLGWIVRTHPTIAELPVDVITALQALVPGFRSSPTTARDVLFADRCLRVDLGDGRGAQRVLVPILDLLNHHASGPSGTWDGDSFAVSVRRPFGTDECALDYGRDRDALEMAAVYGFADGSAQIAHLPAVHVDVPSVGKVRLRAVGRQPDGSFADLAVTVAAGETVISHITVGIEPPSMQRLVSELAAVPDWDHAMARRVLSTLVVAAAEQVTHLADLCAGYSPAEQTVASAARCQLGVLDAAAALLD